MQKGPVSKESHDVILHGIRMLFFTLKGSVCAYRYYFLKKLRYLFVSMEKKHYF